MKIRINNRVVDMSLRCFEFTPTAKEMKFNACSSQSAGAVVLTLRRWGKNHIKQLTDIVCIKRPPDILRIKQQTDIVNIKQQTIWTTRKEPRQI